MPTIALGEFHYGVLKSDQRDELEPWLEELERDFIVLTPDVETSAFYAELRWALELIGLPVPYHDIWIGALALQYGLPVVSRDGHFDRMPGVTRISW